MRRVDAKPRSGPDAERREGWRLADGRVGSAAEAAFRRRWNRLGGARINSCDRASDTPAALLVIGVLAVVNVGVNFVPIKRKVAFAPAVAGTLVLVGRARGLSWQELALPTSNWLAGVKYAAVAVVSVAGVYLIGAVLPTTRAAFLDTRYRQGLPAAAYAALMTIPTGTVLLEEVAFRGVLWGLLNRRHGPLAATAATSSLFGLWHVLPSLELARANRAVIDASRAGGLARPAAVIGAVLFTTLAGVVLAQLRRQSGSLLAPVGLHWATNALGVVFASLVWTRGDPGGGAGRRSARRRGSQRARAARSR